MLVFVSAIFLAGLIFITGCGMTGQGQTAAERKRQHSRTWQTAKQQVADDLDKVMLYDKPSSLSSLRTR